MRRFSVPLLLMALAACADRATVPTSSNEPVAAGDAAPAPVASPVSQGPAAAQREALARRVARALRDPAFRQYVRAGIAASPDPEGKLHLARFLRADGGRGVRALAEADGISAVSVEDEVDAAPALELYFPVPEHRRAWTGGPDLLVGTIGRDGELPVGFDIQGGRQALDPAGPPAAPVLAVVPLETDFDRPVSGPARATCTDCGGEGDGGSGGSGGSGGGVVPSTTTVPGLYMTASHLNEKFESWLKGAPEIEVLVLGQKGATDSLTSYQCIGERAVGGYKFDQNDLNWTGNVLMMSQLQLDAYRQQHPGQGYRLFFMEDDDTSCTIKANENDVRTLLAELDAAVRGLSAGRDTTVSGIGKFFRYLPAMQKVISTLGSLINSNDDLIGNAVEDVTTAERYAGYNWIVKGDNGTTNGYIQLQMR